LNNLFLFIIPCLIWGSTWLVIKFQLGVVDPMVSVFYRFLLAGILLLAYCKIKGLNLKFSIRQHMFMFLLGSLLFSINYWLVYIAELSLASGLVAVVFSSLIFLNTFNGAIFLKSKIRKNVLFSAVIGFIGIALIFRDEIFSFHFSNIESIALLLAVISSLAASLGNITSAYNQRSGLPVIQTNAFGMIYGSLLMMVIAIATGQQFNFDFSFAYISSLLYLSVFGSIIAFASYLTLIGKIGADKTAYITLVVPVIALALSTVFEGYQWTAIAFLGLTLILAGNTLVLAKK
jgi:drug/metabolite transporter (DMT)-like permease